MYVHRLRVMTTEMYKISNDLGPKYIYDLCTVKTSKHHLRNSRIINQPKFKMVRNGMNSFISPVAKLWNTMNNDAKVFYEECKSLHCNLKCIYVYDSYALLYYTHLLISLSGNSTVVLMLSVKYSTPTLNKVSYLILSYLILSYLILSYLILSYLILSYLILS